jgi:hypothetical protein
MNGTIPPLPNTSSWRGVELKEAQGQLYLTFLPALGGGEWSCLLLAALAPE